MPSPDIHSLIVLSCRFLSRGSVLFLTWVRSGPVCAFLHPQWCSSSWGYRAGKLHSDLHGSLSATFLNLCLHSRSWPRRGPELCFRPLLSGATLCFSDFLEAELTPQRKDTPKVKALLTHCPSSPSQCFFHSQEHRPGLPSLPSLLRKDSVFIMRDRTDGVRGVGPAGTRNASWTPGSMPLRRTGPLLGSLYSLTPSPLLRPSFSLPLMCSSTRSERLSPNRQATVPARVQSS